MLGLLGLVASACTADTLRPDTARSSDIPEDGGPQVSGVDSTRTATGVAAAGGTLTPSPACPEAPDPQSPDSVTVAWSSPDLTELAAIGVETLVLDEPSLIVEAYINEVNAQGGIGGKCLRLAAYSWNLSDPDGSFREICTDLVDNQPLVLLSLWTNVTTLRCATFGAKIPTMGIHTSFPGSLIEAASGMATMAAGIIDPEEALFLGDGSVEFLLSTSLQVAARAGVMTSDDRIGLLGKGGAGAESQIATVQAEMERLGLQMVASASVPSEFGTAGVSAAESSVRLLEGGLTDAEIEEGQQNFSRLVPERAEVLRQIEQYFLSAAEQFRGAGVTTVVSSATSADVRRLMRAAERLDWTPRWITNDSQPAVLTLDGAPRQQSGNLVHVSARRAAGDPVPELDRGCVSLRNTSTGAPPFSHRTHTDAWTLITDTCDLLDVTFAAMTRVAGPLTRDALIDELGATRYETGYGARIAFGPDDRNGSDRFRVLRADPDCVLNHWGCLRAAGDW